MAGMSIRTQELMAGIPKPFPTPIPDPDEDTEHRTFITLNNITERDGLVPEFIPNGRIVRVNDTVSGLPEYYQWNAESKEWEVWDIQNRLDSIDEILDATEIRIVDIEEDLETRRQNDILENALAGLPEMTTAELNERLEARLHGEEVL